MACAGLYLQPGSCQIHRRQVEEEEGHIRAWVVVEVGPRAYQVEGVGEEVELLGGVEVEVVQVQVQIQVQAKEVEGAGL